MVGFWTSLLRGPVCQVAGGTRQPGLVEDRDDGQSRHGTICSRAGHGHISLHRVEQHFHITFMNIFKAVLKGMDNPGRE